MRERGRRLWRWLRATTLVRRAHERWFDRPIDVAKRRGDSRIARLRLVCKRDP